MNTWIKALVIACLLEVPLFLVLEGTKPADQHKSLLLILLWWYHLPSGLFGYTVNMFWNHMFRLGPGTASNVVFWSSEFSFQVALTTPIVFLIIRSIRRSRSRRNQGQ